MERALSKGDDRLRDASAEAIGMLGKRTPATMAALQMATKDKDESVRKSASEALSKLQH